MHIIPMERFQIEIFSNIPWFNTPMESFWKFSFLLKTYNYYPSIYLLQLICSWVAKATGLGEKPSQPPPHQHFPAHSGGRSQAREDTPSSEFWVFPDAFYQWDMPGTPLKGGVQESLFRMMELLTLTPSLSHMKAHNNSATCIQKLVHSVLI